MRQTVGALGKRVELGQRVEKDCSFVCTRSRIFYPAWIKGEKQPFQKRTERTPHIPGKKVEQEKETAFDKGKRGLTSN